MRTKLLSILLYALMTKIIRIITVIKDTNSESLVNTILTYTIITQNAPYLKKSKSQKLQKIKSVIRLLINIKGQNIKRKNVRIQKRIKLIMLFNPLGIALKGKIEKISTEEDLKV